MSKQIDRIINPRISKKSLRKRFTKDKRHIIETLALETFEGWKYAKFLYVPLKYWDDFCGILNTVYQIHI